MTFNENKFDSAKIIEESKPVTLDNIAESYQLEHVQIKEESLGIEKE